MTAAEAGLTVDEQIDIALHVIAKMGGTAKMNDIKRAVGRRLGEDTLSKQGADSLRRLVNTDAVRKGYIQPHDKENPGWRMTPAGEQRWNSIKAASVRTTPLAIIPLEQELDELQSRPQTPETLQKVQRVLKTYERPSRITQYVKRMRKPLDTCQLCNELGFIKRNGKRYTEVHHLFHLSKNPPPKCLAPEYLIVLCATCHRRMHFADVGEPVREGNGWRVRVDDEEYRFVTG
jgi:5-methylcytosine-specific restriction endonuclease McrA